MLNDSPLIMTGLIIFGLIPGGGMTSAYTGLLKGNVGLSAAVTFLCMLINIVSVPVLIKLFIGDTVDTPFFLIMKFLFIIIFIPFFTAKASQKLIIKIKGREKSYRIIENMKVIPGYGLIVMMFSMSALNAEYLFDNPGIILKVIPPVFLFLTSVLICSVFLGKITRACEKDHTAMIFSSTVKNTAIAIALASLVYGVEVTSAMVIAGPFVQLPIMLAYLRIYKK